jgi:isoleucyl-tRNA synthetase
MPESVHLDSYPIPDDGLRDSLLEDRMDRVIRAASMGRALRVKHDLKIRQPLSAVTLVTRDEDERRGLEELAHLVQEELNVKEVLFTDNEDDLVTVAAKGNFRALGKRFGKSTPQVAAAIAALLHADIRALEAGESRALTVGELEAVVTIDDILLDRTEREGLIVENDGSLTVGIETELNDELIAEGRARELVSKLQGMRKDADFSITDRIGITIACGEELMSAVMTHRDHIMNEVLATRLDAGEASYLLDINGLECRVEIQRK